METLSDLDTLKALRREMSVWKLSDHQNVKAVPPPSRKVPESPAGPKRRKITHVHVHDENDSDFEDIDKILPSPPTSQTVLDPDPVRLEAALQTENKTSRRRKIEEMTQSEVQPPKPLVTYQSRREIVQPKPVDVRMPFRRVSASRLNMRTPQPVRPASPARDSRERSIDSSASPAPQSREHRIAGLPVEGAYLDADGKKLILVPWSAIPVSIQVKTTNHVAKMSSKGSDWLERAQHSAHCTEMWATGHSCVFTKDDRSSSACRRCVNRHDVCCWLVKGRIRIIALPRSERKRVGPDSPEFWCRSSGRAPQAIWEGNL
ncbi:hypothetical protein LTR27_001619 [Elasticomyces elasticus]|nr:hypothetical protein LTR27_001619 [Elasticomyces elasticus]